MKLIVFQGNPGLRYRKTRHNLAWMVANNFAKTQGAKWRNLPKFAAEVAELTEGGEKILLAKPQKYYNLTGEVVRDLAKFYKLNPAKDLLVVTDDINLDFGVVRYREGGGSGGNNGLKSIIQHLGTEGFARVRLGTNDKLRANMDDAKFVLSRFSREEAGKILEIAKEVQKHLKP